MQPQTSVLSNGETQVTQGSSSTSFETKPMPFIHRFITNWLITDPSLSEKYHHDVPSQAKKNYQIQPHEEMKFIYFFGGRWRSLKQKPINLVTGVLAIIPAVIFWIFESSWVWHQISPSLVIIFTYFWVLSFTLFVRSSVSDPGVLPRNIHIPVSFKQSKVDHAPDEYFNTIALPYYKSEYDGVTVKYCTTCHIWRPPRTSHCGVCNSCCSNHDHHCIFLNNCVGYRNYKYFLWFLLTAVLSSFFIIILPFIHLFHYKLVASSEIHSIHQSIRENPMSLFLIIYGFLCGAYPFLLLCFHLFLTACNITTREYLNYVHGSNGQATSKHKQGSDGFINVFDTRSAWKNLYINWLGRPTRLAAVKLSEDFQQGDLRFKKVYPLETFEV
ncbi:zf-DHHC-domain-containing protein [Suhomyces tanzawaensis NRRL Y-17324]|uniref:Palmitoyltransferase n=1 Tax=Suhomyces tanzawaensis NRRL Y-17324 TaxID=984487 RepID=A0A1E4SLI9_9ASCO|nr:zf-DHHC-domain-containing protein [Suhomyces tanzawaensis NRRL Y-17324]ODV80374.1 zf-DHHC-domain-containing protein [Suhomyces tanzawaensis NRRL Y-17324]